MLCYAWPIQSMPPAWVRSISVVCSRYPAHVYVEMLHQHRALVAGLSTSWQSGVLPVSSQGPPARGHPGGAGAAASCHSVYSGRKVLSQVGALSALLHEVIFRGSSDQGSAAMPRSKSPAGMHSGLALTIESGHSFLASCIACKACAPMQRNAGCCAGIGCRRCWRSGWRGSGGLQYQR